MNRARVMTLIWLLTFWWLCVPAVVRAHCDTMNGPVVKDARDALKRGDVTPVLKWVKKEDEDKVRGEFQEALVARNQNPARHEQTDLRFFETLVKLHRFSEGEPYAGLKPAGAEVEPVVAAADHALETGSVASLVSLVTDKAAHGIRERFLRI